jgi:hypothetical protein
MEFQRNTDQQLNLSNLGGVETVEDVEDVEEPEPPCGAPSHLAGAFPVRLKQSINFLRDLNGPNLWESGKVKDER